MTSEHAEILERAAAVKARSRALARSADELGRQVREMAVERRRSRIRRVASRPGVRRTVSEPDREPTIEEAAERALLLELTAQEIAAATGNASDDVVAAAARRGIAAGRPVEDELRDWFRAIVD
jgi:hypothetical protein